MIIISINNLITNLNINKSSKSTKIINLMIYATWKVI